MNRNPKWLTAIKNRISRYGINSTDEYLIAQLSIVIEKLLDNKDLDPSLLDSLYNIELKEGALTNVKTEKI